MDDEEEQARAMFIPASAIFGRDPNEVRKADMEVEALFGQFSDWMKNAPEEDIVMIRRIMGLGQSNKETGAQFLGMLAVVSNFRFGNCLGCGQNHYDTADLSEAPAPE